MTDLAGVSAVVTGAAGGLGGALLVALGEAGASCTYAIVRDEQDEVTVKLPASTRLIKLVANIADEAEVRRAAAQCGDASLLINCAGFGAHSPLIGASSTEGARQEMDVNFFGTLNMCRAFAPILAANGGGCIVNVLSILGWVNLPISGSYCASKAALWSLTQGVRGELAPAGTQVLAVLPGLIDTPMAAGNPMEKSPPSLIARAILKAIEDGTEEVFPDGQSQGLAEQLRTDPKGAERALSEVRL